MASKPQIKLCEHPLLMIDDKDSDDDDSDYNDDYDGHSDDTHGQPRIIAATAQKKECTNKDVQVLLRCKIPIRSQEDDDDDISE